MVETVIFTFEASGRVLRIRKHGGGFWVNGSEIGEKYVPLFAMLSKRFGRRKVDQLRVKMTGFSNLDDLEAYLKREIGGLGFVFVKRDVVEV